MPKGILNKEMSQNYDTSRQDWFFYILRCSDNSLYSGITNNLEARLKEHNKGIGAKYTHTRRPVIIVYSEKYDNVSGARKREEQVKGWSRAKKGKPDKGFFWTSLGIKESRHC